MGKKILCPNENNKVALLTVLFISFLTDLNNLDFGLPCSFNKYASIKQRDGVDS